MMASLLRRHPHGVSSLWWAWLWLVCGLWVSSAWATAAAPNKTDEVLATARHQMDELQKQLTADTKLDALARRRAQAVTLQSQCAAIAADLAPQVANLAARRAELGEAPAEPGSETADMTAQRSSLVEQHAHLDAQLRFARLLTVESEQATAQIDALRRTRFQAQLGERTTSPLTPAFWSGLQEAWPQNARRLSQVGQRLVDAVQEVGEGFASILLGGVVSVALILWWVGRRVLLAVASTRLPAGRLRRSFLALGLTLWPSVVALAATTAVRLGLGGSEAPIGVDALLGDLVSSVSFGIYVAALGRALMSPQRPSWRLPPMPDPVARRLRRDPLLLGLTITLGLTLERLAGAVSTDLSTDIAIDTLFSLALATLLMRTLRRGEQARREAAASADAGQAPPRSLWLLAIAVAGWSVLAVSMVCLLLGYVALGSLIIKQVAWVIIVASSVYLLASFLDDASMTWVGASASAPAEAATHPPTLRRQAAVLLSAAGRFVLLLAGLAVMLGPLEQAPIDLVQRAGSLREGLQIGEVRLAPAAVLQAIFVFGVGLLGVRLAQRWLMDSYLPTTSLDEGMRSSTTTLLGYVGLVVAGALALSAMGLGLERVAWVASALSVGIGFGLQAVVQNFISGLILLTERPVKVGDWVALGGIEGDIRRINVRATEIQTGDRSTVIVPNSEFITKVVRNVTHANPLGLVQIKLPMPLDTDAEQARALMLEALQSHPDVLKAPAPTVLLDTVDGTHLVFNATGSVNSPRQVSAVKSALLFDILARLKVQGLSLSRPPSKLLLEAQTLAALTPPHSPP